MKLSRFTRFQRAFPLYGALAMMALLAVACGGDGSPPTTPSPPAPTALPPPSPPEPELQDGSITEQDTAGCLTFEIWDTFVTLLEENEDRAALYIAARFDDEECAFFDLDDPIEWTGEERPLSVLPDESVIEVYGVPYLGLVEPARAERGLWWVPKQTTSFFEGSPEPMGPSRPLPEPCLPITDLGVFGSAEISRTGTLGPGCVSPNAPGAVYARFFRLSVLGTTWVQIDMVSTSTVDPVLFLYRGADDIEGGEQLGWDDDSGLGLDARITAELTRGTYLIEASQSALWGAESGSFTLTVAPTAPPTTAEPPAAHSVPVGGRASGTGPAILDVPDQVTRFRIEGEYSDYVENFVVWCGSDTLDGRGGLLVNVILGTSPLADGTRYSGVHANERSYNGSGEPCGELEIMHSMGLRWTITDVSGTGFATTPTAGTGSGVGDQEAVRRSLERAKFALSQGRGQ